MTPRSTRRLLLLATARSAPAAQGIVRARARPAGPLRMVMAFPAGGATDHAGRAT